MYKFLFVAATGMLAIWIGGCGNGSGDSGASPSPSPGASPAASPTASPASPSASAPSPTTRPGTPGAQSFPSPVVTPRPSIVASAPDLIRSTDPNERARQAQTEIARNQRTTAVPLAPQPPQVPVAGDPFSVLPPQPLRDSPEANSGNPQFPTQVSRAVPDVPNLPRDINPPSWRGATGGGNAPPQTPNTTGQQVSGLPNLPLPSRPPQWQSPLPAPRGGSSSPATTTPRGGPSSPGATTPQGTPPRGGRPVPPGSSGGPGRGRGGTGVAARPAPRIPNLPTVPPVQVPDLPQSSPTEQPAQWVPPAPPPGSQPSRPAAPPPPSTDLARGVEVTGVVRVSSNVVLVILKAPGEPTSRYVRVGQRVANGQVIVKRVEFRPGADPIVILEENGVEIAKEVGEKAIASAPQP